jgi:hypothetical protein
MRQQPHGQPTTRAFAGVHSRWSAIRAAAAVGILALSLVGGGQPVGAVGWTPESCAAERELRDWMVSQPDIFGGQTGKLAIEQANNNLNNLCDDQSVGVPPGDAPNPARVDPPAADPPVAVQPDAAPPADDGPDNRVETDRSACVLLTESEVGAAMRASVTANAADPFGVAGAQGCEFDSSGAAHTNVIYLQANGAFFYESFHSTAEPNGVQTVAGVGDRAFSYIGGSGPGLVVAKGDKVFALEFSGIGTGAAEKTSLLNLAQQAVARVH